MSFCGICLYGIGPFSGLDRERSTLDVLLSTTYSRSQLYLSRQLAQLHPELTMPMFSGLLIFFHRNIFLQGNVRIFLRIWNGTNVKESLVSQRTKFSLKIEFYFPEICHRLQTARPSVIKCLLYYLLPWLYNLELVDPNVSPECEVRVDPQQSRGREGWGSSEATEMITNNLFYITVKVKLKKNV